MIWRLTAPVLRHLRTKTRRRVAFLAAWVMVYVGGSLPAYADKTSPEGLGGLITTPDLSGGQPKTLLETYGPQRYSIFKDLGGSDLAANAAYPLYEALDQLAYAFTKLAVGLTWWQQTASTSTTGTDSIGQGIQSTAGALLSWLLPTTLVVGAGIAYAKSKRAEDALGQLSIVVLIAGCVVGLSYHAKEVVGFADNTRVLTAKLVNSAGVTSIAKQNEPFKFSKDPTLKPGAKYSTERAAGDVVWRQFYVTPWCQTMFGSRAACKRYADTWLATKGYEDRKEYLENGITDKEDDDEDAPTVRYIKGHSPGTRIGTSLLAVGTSAGACIVIGGLAFFSLLPWLLALVLMFLVVFFLCLMVIPGPMRDIGRDYCTTILGQIILSALMGGLLSGMLLLVMQAAKASATKGWVFSMLVTAAALGAGWVGRKILSQKLTGSTSGGMGGGLLAGMMLSRMAGRMGRSLRAGKGGRKSGRGSGGSPSEGGGRGGGSGERAEHAAERAGQVAGAVRHPGTATRRGLSSAHGYYSARKQRARDSRDRIKDAARGGYEQTGGSTGRGGHERRRGEERSGGGGRGHSDELRRQQHETQAPERQNTRADEGKHVRHGGRSRPAHDGTGRTPRRGEHGATSKNLSPRNTTAGRGGSRPESGKGQNNRPRPSRAGGSGRGSSKPMRRRSETPTRSTRTAPGRQTDAQRERVRSGGGVSGVSRAPNGSTVPRRGEAPPTPPRRRGGPASIRRRRNR